MFAYYVIQRNDTTNDSIHRCVEQAEDFIPKKRRFHPANAIFSLMSSSFLNFYRPPKSIYIYVYIYITPLPLYFLPLVSDGNSKSFLYTFHLFLKTFYMLLIILVYFFIHVCFVFIECRQYLPRFL